MEVTRLTEQLSKGSSLYRWSTTVLLSYVTMKAAFDIFILNLATAEVPFHCNQVVIDNRTLAWDSVNTSAIEAGANFSIAEFKCTAPRFRRDPGGVLVPIQGGGGGGGGGGNESGGGPIRCQAWAYQPTEAGRVNMLMEYDFVCDRAYLGDRMQTIMQAGIFVSSCFAPLSDAFGRKLPFILFVYIDIASTVFVTFIRDLRAQMVLRFFMGFGSPAVLTGVAYLTELISEEYHALHGNFYWILWVVGYTTSGVIAYLVLQWRHQIVVVAVVIATGYLGYPWLLVESPKWLFASGRRAAARDALIRLYRRHGLDTSVVEEMKVEEAADVEEVGLKSSVDGEAATDGRTRRNDGRSCSSRFRDFLPKESLCNAKYLLVELSFTVLFVANAMSYFSSSFRRDFITKNPYLNVVISGSLELPAAFAAWLLTVRCGRRISNILLLITAGLLLVLVPFIPQSEAVTFGAKSACALLSKFLITISFSIVLIYGSESLPTTIRATSFIVASQAMRLGQTLAPELTNFLAAVTPALPNLFYGGFCIASGLLIIFLAETHNKPMPDTIADMEGLRLPSCGRSLCRRGQDALRAAEPSSSAGEKVAVERF